MPLPSSVRLAGYIGGTSGGKVRLYASLESPSQFLEISEEDVLYSEEANGDVLPGKGMYLWVNAEAQIHCVRFEAANVEARYLAGPIAEAYLAGEQAEAVSQGMPITLWCPKPPPTISCWPLPPRWCGVCRSPRPFWLPPSQAC